MTDELITYPSFQLPDGWALSDSTWLYSDTHFGPKSKLVDIGMRPADHHECMVINWHDAIFPNEPVLHLGDFEFIQKYPLPERAPFYTEIKGLPGVVVGLLGNHDGHTRSWYQRKFGWYTMPSKADKGVILTIDPISQKRIAFSHSPLLVTSFPWDVNIHGHIHTNGYGYGCRDLVAQGKQYICVCIEYYDYQPVRVGDILRALRYPDELDVVPGHYANVGLATNERALGIGAPPPDGIHQVFHVPYQVSTV